MFQLYLNQVMNYLPENYPRPYLNMMGYLESRIPRMSSNTYDSIYNSINKYISPEYMGRAEYMAFAMETSLRYMNFAYVSKCYVLSRFSLTYVKDLLITFSQVIISGNFATLRWILMPSPCDYFRHPGVLHTEHAEFESASGKNKRCY